MPGKISFGPTAYSLFVDAQERKKANEKDFTISFKVDKNEYQLMEKFVNHWLGIPEIPDIAFPRFGPKKTFTAWGPTTIHPTSDVIYHQLHHQLQVKLQASADKAWRSLDIQPKVNLSHLGFPAVSDYCSAALSAVKAAERIVIAPSIILAPNNNHSDIARTHHYTHDFKPFQGLFKECISQFDMVSDSDNKWEVFKIVDGDMIPVIIDSDLRAKASNFHTSRIEIKDKFENIYQQARKFIDDYPDAKSPLGRTNKQHKLIMDMNKKGKRR